MQFYGMLRVVGNLDEDCLKAYPIAWIADGGWCLESEFLFMYFVME